MHDEILRFWPALGPVIALHLADDTGTPMHAEANGWYSLAGYYGGAGERYHAGNASYRDTSPEALLRSFAGHVRVDVEQARHLAAAWLADGAGAWLAVRALYAAWLAEQAPRWQAEADAAVALLDARIARQEAPQGSNGAPSPGA